MFLNLERMNFSFGGGSTLRQCLTTWKMQLTRDVLESREDELLLRRRLLHLEELPRVPLGSLGGANHGRLFVLLLRLVVVIDLFQGCLILRRELVANHLSDWCRRRVFLPYVKLGTTSDGNTFGGGPVGFDNNSGALLFLLKSVSFRESITLFFRAALLSFL